MRPEGVIVLLIVLPIFFVVEGSTIWATIDAVGLQRYKYKGYSNAFVVFIGCELLWIVCFPLYLIKRGAIVNGTAELRPEYENDPPPRMRNSQQNIYSRNTANQRLNSQESRYERLQKLGELKDKGILTEEEFIKEKSKII